MWDAVLNGIAFLGLAIGLAIGWRRSPALRETLLELFLPSHGTGPQSHHANGAAPDGDADRMAIIFQVIAAEHSHEDAGRDADADDRQTLHRLRAIRA